MTFRAAPPGALSIVALDGLTAIYDHRSGQTHMVAEPVPAMLATLQQPLDASALAVVLGLDVDAATMRLIAARIDELLLAGLIELS